MKTVKLSIDSPGLYRQTPNNDGFWGDYKFIINESVDECDFWVVYSKWRKQNDVTKVAPENMIFISGEPETIYHYAKGFIRNFATVVTTRDDIHHKNIIQLQPAQPWWCGRRMRSDGSIDFALDFNDFKLSPDKTKLISIITSNKGSTKGHKDRIRFVQQLSEYFGESLDVFGRGINGFEDKWDTLKEYKYHIVIENSSYHDYWTEKLADSFLAESFPFYFGCNNLEKYFPDKSYQLIDIYNVKKSIEIIENGINSNVADNNREFLLSAKQKVLYEYNIFPMICGICDQMDAFRPKKSIYLRYEKSYFDPFKIPLTLKRVYYSTIYK